jgi:hypothetical protein
MVILLKAVLHAAISEWKKLREHGDEVSISEKVENLLIRTVTISFSRNILAALRILKRLNGATS